MKKIDNPARLRSALVAAMWLAGTLLATGVVYAAVNVVAGQVSEPRPEPMSQAAIGHALAHQDLPTSSPAPSPVTPSATAAPHASPTPSSGTPSTGDGPAQQGSPATPTPPTTRSFSLLGGTAGLRCTGGQISLDWATPNPGFRVDTGTSDGGAKVEVRFRSDAHVSQLEAWCAGDQVQGTVQEESS